MDPGNRATDLEGGARFGYELLWVLVMSNAMAILVQTLSARLGMIPGPRPGASLPGRYPRPVSICMGACEIAIAACDLAEVLGAAIGLNLLFGLPLLAGDLLTATDTLLLLWFQRFGIRDDGSFRSGADPHHRGCFFIEIPVQAGFLRGHHRAGPAAERLESLYLAIAILGATVMPHNLYLHSALVQTRQLGDSEESKHGPASTI